MGFVEGYKDADQEGNRVVKAREGGLGCGKRRESKGGRKAGRTYKEKVRSFIRFGSERGFRAEAWSLGGSATALDAELSALVRVLELCLLDLSASSDAIPGASCNVFTDSQAAITRLRDDRPGPGQHMASRGIRLTTEIVQRGATVSIRWVPGHARVPGNEIADQWANEAATREDRCRAGRRDHSAPPIVGQHASQAFVRTTIRRRVVLRWRGEVIRRGSGGRQCRTRGRVAPRIPLGLRGAPKEVATRFFQLASGHAMIAPFLRDKFRWIESDSCWWCSGGRQSREHLFKECRVWKDEIRTLWKEVGEISGTRENKMSGNVYKGRKCFCFGMRRSMVHPGNCSIKKLMSEDRSTEAVLKFLESTGVGKVKEGVTLNRG